MVTEYFLTWRIADEISQVHIRDIKVYNYLLELMKMSFGFERYILKNQVNSDGGYLIELAVPKETLDRHLDQGVVASLKSIMG